VVLHGGVGPYIQSGRSGARTSTRTDARWRVWDGMASSAEDAEGATSDMEVDKSGWAQLPEELIIQVLEQLGRVGRETSVVRLMCARWRSVHDHWAEQQGWAGLPEELMTMVLQRLQPQPPGAALLGFFESPSVVGQMGIPNFPSNGVLQATGQPSRQDARPVGFHRATAVVSCVCARWQRLHDALVTRLVVSYQVTDEQMHILVQRFPAATSVQVIEYTNPRYGISFLSSRLSSVF